MNSTTDFPQNPLEGSEREQHIKIIEICQQIIIKTSRRLTTVATMNTIVRTYLGREAEVRVDHRSFCSLSNLVDIPQSAEESTEGADISYCILPTGSFITCIYTLFSGDHTRDWPTTLPDIEVADAAIQTFRSEKRDRGGSYVFSLQGDDYL